MDGVLLVWGFWGRPALHAGMHACMHALARGGHILGPGGVAGLGPWAPALGGLWPSVGLVHHLFLFSNKKDKGGRKAKC